MSDWILFSAGHPDDGSRVLAWADGWQDVKIMHFIVTNEGWWWHNEGSLCMPEDMPLIPEDGDILPTHWMPLPEQPRTTPREKEAGTDGLV